MKSKHYLLSGSASVIALLIGTGVANADLTITTDQSSSVVFDDDDSILIIEEGVTVEDDDETISVSGKNAQIINKGILLSEEATLYIDGGGDIQVNNLGNISAHAINNDELRAVHVDETADSVFISNSGSISVFNEMDYDAWGIHIENASGPVTIENTGEISVETADDYYTLGIHIENEGGNDIGAITVSNSGRISSISLEDDSFGVHIENGEFGDAVNSLALISLTNDASGEVIVSGEEDVFSLHLENYSQTDIQGIKVENAGLLEANSQPDTSGGIVSKAYAEGVIGFSSLSNSGEISASSSNKAYGIFSDIYGESGTGKISASNTGCITATSSSEDALGINLTSEVFGNVDGYYIENTGKIRASAGVDASGLKLYNEVDGEIGEVAILNSGDLLINAVEDAQGLSSFHQTNSELGNVTVNNSGTVEVEGGEDALGLNMLNSAEGGIGDVTLTNSGFIDGHGIEEAYGINLINYTEGNIGEIQVLNSGRISTRSSNDAQGVQIENETEGDSSGFLIANSGEITALASDDARGIIIENSVQGANKLLQIINSGAILASSSDDTAGGIDVTNDNSGGSEGVLITNTGSILSEADVQARAINVRHYDETGSISIVNAGTLESNAGVGAGAGIVAISDAQEDDIFISNSGTVHATGEDFSTGIYASHVQDQDQSITLVNSGRITGEAALELISNEVNLQLENGSVIDGTFFVNANEMAVNIENGLNLALTYETRSGVSDPDVTVSSEMPVVHDAVQNKIYSADLTSLALPGYYLQTLSNAAQGTAEQGINSTSSSEEDSTPLLWGKAFGGYETQSANGESPEITQAYGGLLSGAFRQTGEHTFGIFAGGVYNTLENQHKTLKLDSQTAVVGVQARINKERFWVDATMIGGYAWFDSERQVANNTVAGGLETAKADYSGYLLAPSLALGLRVSERVSLSTRGQYAGLFVGEIDETGSEANLTTEDYSAQVASIRAQMDVQAYSSENENGTFESALRFGADAFFDLGTNSESVQLGGLPINLPDLDRDAITAGFAGVSLNYASKDGLWSVGGDIEGRFGSDTYADLRGSLGFKLRF
ncbi:autotransporter outer membrane beta-barrel domain-containing protein [Pseudovibrio sp. SCP19]|uniref:autotransporter outer membrane beta-barrel domain-containing protein n=1 Tax=Pseudovibrio sp. SCP19 TaxID=3141374 RepID=UPI003338BF3F